MSQDVDDYRKDMNDINESLKVAEKHGLQVEVVWSALLYMKRYPDATLSDAIEYGLSEWVK